jgi:hypothetical protein
VNFLTLRIEAVEAGGIFAACKLFYGMARSLAVWEQVQQAAIAPGVTRNDWAVEKGEGITERSASILEQLFKNRPHGEYRGAAINVQVIDFTGMHFAPRSGSALEQSNAHTGSR